MSFKITVKDEKDEVVSQTVFVDASVGSSEEKEEDEKSENEKFYDAEIAPALAEIAKKAREKGMSFASMVEYDQGDTGNTIYTQKVGDMSPKMMMSVLSMKANGNVDAFMIAMKKYARENNIDTSGSMFLYDK